MDDRVLSSRGAAEIFENGGNVSARQEFSQIIDCPRDAVVQVGTGDRVKSFRRNGLVLGSSLPACSRVKFRPV